jgi:hypothetical protein
MEIAWNVENYNSNPWKLPWCIKRLEKVKMQKTKSDLADDLTRLMQTKEFNEITIEKYVKHANTPVITRLTRSIKKNEIYFRLTYGWKNVIFLHFPIHLQEQTENMLAVGWLSSGFISIDICIKIKTKESKNLWNIFKAIAIIIATVLTN